MTLRFRRILYSTFIILFFLAAPPLVLYTAGFRYDFQYNRVVETGSLVVKSYPEDVTIVLDGVQYRETTPTIINTILPGKIKLLLNREGYFPVEKEIEIFPRVTTFEDTIRLFANIPPKTIIEGVQQYWWNKNRDKLAYMTLDNKLRLLNLLNNKDTLIAQFEKKPFQYFSWSPHSDNFIFARGTKQDAEYIIVDAQAFERIIPLSNIIQTPLHKVSWDPVTSSALFALNDKNELIRFNILIKTIRTVDTGQVLDYQVTNDRIIVLKQLDSSTAQLIWFTLSDTSTVHLLPEVVPSKQATIMPTNTVHIALYSSQAELLQIIDPSIKAPLREKTLLTIEEAMDVYWSDNGETLVYSDGFGLYTHSFVTPISITPIKTQPKLVTRYSLPISTIALTQSGDHALYVVHNELRVIRLNSSGNPRSTTLVTDIGTIHDIQHLEQYDSITYIDEKNSLKALPLSLEKTGSLLFSNE
jgi:hypothetical protein